jgi:hypothetical protein
LVLKAKVHSGAKVPDQDGLRLLLKSAREELLARLKHLWVDAGYEGSASGGRKRPWAKVSRWWCVVLESLSRKR